MYKKQFENLTNVTVAYYSPRQSGETEARSAWKEVKDLPHSVAERIGLVQKLASEHAAVHLRAATYGGRARLYVKNS